MKKPSSLRHTSLGTRLATHTYFLLMVDHWTFVNSETRRKVTRFSVKRKIIFYNFCIDKGSFHNDVCVCVSFSKNYFLVVNTFSCSRSTARDTFFDLIHRKRNKK